MTSRRPHTTAAALLAAAAFVLAGCGGGSSAAPADAGSRDESAATVTLLAPLQAHKLITKGGVQVLDVRTPEEFAAGHVKGATMIDFYEPDFAERIAKLDRNATYVVYCRSGNRSGKTATLMKEQGFSAVSDVDGGVIAWEAAGLPLQR